MTDIKSVKKERGKRYGSFEDNARLVQQLEHIFEEYSKFSQSSSVHKEGTHMILQKLSRCFGGDFWYEDNWVDIIGYAHCVLEFIQKTNKENDEEF